MPVLVIRSLRKSFHLGSGQSPRRIEALAGVDLDVDEGEIVGIVGGKGAGKTALLLCIAGLLRRDGGSIKWNGEQITGCVPGVSFMPAVPTYYPFLTVREVFDYYCSRERDACARRARLIPDVARKLGLTNYLTATVGNLDVEMLKRVAVAQAFLDQARVILFDGSLDSLGSGATFVHRLLRESSATIIATSRHAGVLAPIATRIVVMDAGRLTGSFSSIQSGSAFESAPPLTRQIAERLH
jgi:ABC-type multidrug transport system ATPase subunit